MPQPMSSPEASASRDLDQALRQARLREAAHFEAALDIRDAETLRLQVLKDDLAPIVASRREAEDFFDLALVPGDPPRLWLDFITSVVMAPNPRTYRLVQDSQAGRKTLFETQDRGEMVACIRQHMAHRLINRKRLTDVEIPTRIRSEFVTRRDPDTQAGGWHQQVVGREAS